MELAHKVGVSPRHISFVETGRANASRNLLLCIGESLDLPLDARNRLLLAGGYAPAFSEHTLDAERMRPVKAAVDAVLAGHSPYPAVVTDACWNLVAANTGCLVLVEGVDPTLLATPINVMRLCLHPNGLAPRLLNHTEVRSSILRRMRRHVEATAAPDIRQLYDEVSAYPAPRGSRSGGIAGHPSQELYVPFRLATLDGVELRFVNTIATFGSPLDICVESLAMESFFPADTATADYLRRLDDGQRLRAVAAQHPHLLGFVSGG